MSEARGMQALPKLPEEALRSILDIIVSFWSPSEVFSNLLELPDAFLDLWLPGRKVLNLMHSNVSAAILLKFIKKLRNRPEISVLHLPSEVFRRATVAESVDLLNALDAIADTLPNLSVLGIHGLRLRTEHIPSLISLCSVLREKLIGLSLCLEDWMFDQFDGYMYLMEAIGKLRKLEMLVFPDWKEFVDECDEILHKFAQTQKCMVFVRGDPGQEHSLDVSEMAPNLTIVSAALEGADDADDW
jgi:hypothetical protein